MFTSIELIYTETHRKVSPEKTRLFLSNYGQLTMTIQKEIVEVREDKNLLWKEHINEFQTISCRIEEIKP